MPVRKSNYADHQSRDAFYFPGSEKLRSLIISVADNVTVDGKKSSPKVMGEMVPSSYLTLAKMVDDRRTELEEEGTIPLLRRCQFQNMIEENATKHPNDYLDPEDIDVATEFLHNIGKICEFPVFNYILPALPGL